MFVLPYLEQEQLLLEGLWSVQEGRLSEQLWTVEKWLGLVEEGWLSKQKLLERQRSGWGGGVVVGATVDCVIR